MKRALLFAGAGAFLAAASASAQSLTPFPQGPGVVAPSGSTITARPTYAPPPPPRGETPPPPPVAAGATSYVWQPGRWAWTGAKYVWVKGRWSQTTPGMGR